MGHAPASDTTTKGQWARVDKFYATYMYFRKTSMTAKKQSAHCRIYYIYKWVICGTLSTHRRVNTVADPLCLTLVHDPSNILGGGPGTCSPGKFWNLGLQKGDFQRFKGYNCRFLHAFETTSVFRYFKHGLLLKIYKIESDIENKSETSKCKKRLSSINVIFFLFITVFFQKIQF